MAGQSISIRSYAKERQKEIIDRLRSGMDRAVLIVENQAKENVNQTPPKHPQVQTGILRSNITSEVSESGNEIKGRIGTNIIYGKYLEHGHPQTPGQYVPAIGKRLKASQVPAYPWLFPALESKRNEIKDILRGAGHA